MNIEKLNAELGQIDPRLSIEKGFDEIYHIYLDTTSHNLEIYNIGNNSYSDGFNLIPQGKLKKQINKFVNENLIGHAYILDNHTKNPFKAYTDYLAETLLSKNKAYGDSFSKSVDDYGPKVIGIRLSDKYNRIKHLVNAGELKENDESLLDTLLDNAGYSILAYKYLKEHENANNDSK